MKKKKLWIYFVDAICILGILLSAFGVIKSTIKIEKSTKNIYTDAKKITVNSILNTKNNIYIDKNNNVIFSGSNVSKLKNEKEVVVSVEDETLIDSDLAYKLEDGIIYKNNKPVSNPNKYEKLSISECNEILIENQNISELILFSMFGLLVFTLGLISSKDKEDDVYLRD